MSSHDAPRYTGVDFPLRPEHERDHIVFTCSDGTHKQTTAYRSDLGLRWRPPVVIDQLPEGVIT